MDDFHGEALRRLPLAEAGLRVWAWLTEETFLTHVFEQFRGRSYEKVLRFPVLVYLIASVLLHHKGSGRAGFAKAREDGAIEVSVEAAFGKLRRHRRRQRPRADPASSRARCAGCVIMDRRIWALFPA